MADVLKSDVFFFVTTICVIVATIALVFLMIYAISILVDVKHVSKKIKEESEEFINDAREMRVSIKEKGTSLMGVLSLIFGNKKRDTSRKKK
jgi:hypothetical protein